MEELVVARFERYKLIEEKEPMAEEYLVATRNMSSSPTAPPPVLPRRQSASARGGRQGWLDPPHHALALPEKTLQKAADHTKAFLCVEMSMADGG